ncbi:glycosyltransferase family 2 protein [Flavobacterium sinopsychrotolerans]|uniref:Glycosyl transferase family 2 n=1 Tax=Flavobacterium sinopsychrotolerans TaxID=604089 RepID=A0A1H8HM33_9FLAO|nr:hypothetical protein [Flavobacterium sinopsychrotolerans]SEN57260.1 hypothetical protein SAMN04487942_0251 [Flavobacterium sinopsychrotolerans]
MDVLIKSFNRPYYLDRCLQSIYANVLDTTISIKVLDDGTPSRYLEKIKLKFPKIEIFKSESYDEKSNSIENNQDLENTKIPIALWLNTAKQATDYFLLLEDDIWFTRKINFEETQKFLIEENVFSLKLFWLNNPKLIHGTTIKNKGSVTIFNPNVFTKNPFLHRLIFGMTRFNIRKTMGFLKLYSKEKALHYYSIYGVAGAIFNKNYFLSLWGTHNNQVDENLQLKNAVKFWYRNPKIQFARTNEEFVATGFLSSATNKNFDAGEFDIFTFNKILNEAWFSNKFDVMDNFPNDINVSKINAILFDENNPKATTEDWEKWVFLFKNQFQNIGCNI